MFEQTIYSGVDYGKILRKVEEEADGSKGGDGGGRAAAPSFS